MLDERKVIQGTMIRMPTVSTTITAGMMKPRWPPRLRALRIGDGALWLWQRREHEERLKGRRVIGKHAVRAGLRVELDRYFYFMPRR